MKLSNTYIKGIYILCLITTIQFSCKKSDGGAGGGTQPLPVPSITTDTATAITTTAAQCGGFIHNATLSITVSNKGICYSTTHNPTITDTKVSDNSNGLSISCYLVPLLPGTSYYARAFAVTNVGTGYGNEITIQTLPAVLVPIVIIEGQTVSSNKIDVLCKIKSDGDPDVHSTKPVTAYGVCWGISPNPTIANNKTTETIINSFGEYDSVITGLTHNTTYYVRAYATNANGTGYSDQKTLVTSN